MKTWLKIQFRTIHHLCDLDILLLLLPCSNNILEQMIVVRASQVGFQTNLNNGVALATKHCTLHRKLVLTSPSPKEVTGLGMSLQSFGAPNHLDLASNKA